MAHRIDTGSLVPSALEKLPTELQQNIYNHLLKIDCVCQQPKRYGGRPYRLHTEILLVNRQTHQIAHDVLYKDNRFILVTSDWAAIQWAMPRYKVAAMRIRRRFMRSFEQHVMRVHVARALKDLPEQVIDQHNTSRLRTYLMTQNELPYLLHVLHVIDLFYGSMVCPFSITIRINRSVTCTSDLEFQRKLLEPFHLLTSPGMNVNILGCDNSAYVQGLIEGMMHPIRWARMVLWQLYSTTESLFQSAEDALQQGYPSAAIDFYNESERVLRRAHEHNRYLDCGPHDCGWSYLLVVCVCAVNLGLAGLRDPNARARAESARSVLKETTFVLDGHSLLTSLMGKDKIYHCKGIAHAVLGQHEDARQYFLKSMICSPHVHQQRKDHLRIMENLIAAHAEDKDPLAWAYFTDDLPLFKAPDPIYYASETISNERYVLERLDYKGDLLPQIAASSPADLMSTERLLDHLNGRRRCVPPGHVMCVWLSAGEGGAIGVYIRTERLSGPVLPGLI